MDSLKTVIEEALAGLAPKEPTKRHEPTEEQLARAGRYMIRCGYLPHDQPAFTRLAKWIAGPQDRGLFLVGDVGVGKTAFLDMCTSANIATARDLCGNVGGCRGLVDTTLTLAIDDMGAEPVSVTYGQREDIVGGIVTERHKWYTARGTITHVTANVPIVDGVPDCTELKERYGPRVWDRLREMCTMVAFQPGSHRGEK